MFKEVAIVDGLVDATRVGTSAVQEGGAVLQGARDTGRCTEGGVSEVVGERKGGPGGVVGGENLGEAEGERGVSRMGYG